MRKGRLGMGAGIERARVWVAALVCLSLSGPSGAVAQTASARDQAHDRTIPSGARALDPAAVRSEAKATIERLDAQAKGSASALKPGDSRALSPRDAAYNKQLRELLDERLRLLDLYDQAVKEHDAFVKGAVSPEQERSAVKAELARITQRLTEAQTNPDVLLQSPFRAPAGDGSTALSLELKESLDAIAAAIKDDRAKLDLARAEKEKFDGPHDPRRQERDKLFQRVAAYDAKRSEFETAVAAASNASKRRLAQERLVNFDWQVKEEKERLAIMEAQIAAQTNRSDVREWEIELLSARLRLSEQTLEYMRDRYRRAAEDRQRELKRMAEAEDEKAQRSNDPIERFRARRMAEVLTLEAQVVRHEQSLATSPSPSLHEQRELADRAEADFAHIRELLDDGRVSRLDAIRLNNDFRRIGPERDRLARNELANAEAHVQFYEDLLSSVEIELLQDSLHDQFELDFTRERPPADRVKEGKAIWLELERRQRELLNRRRAVLEKLVERAAQILQQVSRRLALLDEEYGFIRTHIFWVRDQDPLGAWSVVPLGRDAEHLVAGALVLVRESLKPKLWGQPSGEFIVAGLAAVMLPLGLSRLRNELLKLITRDDAAPPGPQPFDDGVSVEIASEC